MMTARLFAFLAASLTIAFGCFSTSHAASVTFDWATVGNAGNAGEVQQSGLPSQRGTFGAVATTYRISKTEVTNVQYTEFLNSVDPTAANSLGLFNPRAWKAPTSDTPMVATHFQPAINRATTPRQQTT